MVILSEAERSAAKPKDLLFPSAPRSHPPSPAPLTIRRNPRIRVTLYPILVWQGRKP